MVVMFVIVVFVVNGTFRTIPTVESYGILRGFSTVTGLRCDLEPPFRTPIKLTVVLGCVFYGR